MDIIGVQSALLSTTIPSQDSLLSGLSSNWQMLYVKSMHSEIVRITFQYQYLCLIPSPTCIPLCTYLPERTAMLQYYRAKPVRARFRQRQRCTSNSVRLPTTSSSPLLSS